MAISCPSCHAEIPVADVNVSEGVALCRACSQISRLADLATGCTPAASALPRTARPEGTRIELAEAGDRLIVAMPRGLNRTLGLFLLAFGGFWDLISSIILVGFLSSGSSGTGVEQPLASQAVDWFGVFFVGCFLLVGAGILLAGIYVLTVRVALSIDRDAVTLVRSAFGREWISTRPTATATAVRPVERYKQNDVPKYGVGIAFTGASDLAIGADLTDPELAWLGGEIAHALRRAGATIP